MDPYADSSDDLERPATVETGAHGEVLYRVHGEPVAELPADLYIPPDALEVFLDSFEGPLDLLLYLIRRQNLDILSIPIAEITRQYMGYIEVMQALRLELAGEYLVMAALLAEIKSRMLLPRPKEAEADEDADPRMALIRSCRNTNSSRSPPNEWMPSRAWIAMCSPPAPASRRSRAHRRPGRRWTSSWRHWRR